MKRVTIYDVAKEAGVSLATVSRVINGSNVVKAPTKERVEAAVEKLDSLKQTIKTGVNPEEDLPVQVQEVEKETTNG